MNETAGVISDDNFSELLIVGAGPTGLTLACFCLQLGIRIRIIDKNSGPSTTSKAIGLQYRISEILAYLGIVDRFLERGGSPTPVNIYEGNRKLVTFHFDIQGIPIGREAFCPSPIVIPQSETERLLGDLLVERGGFVEWGSELVDFSQDETKVVSSVRCTDGTQKEIRSFWLVSCEGAHSVIRKQAGISFEGKTYPLTFALADVEIKWNLNHNENHVWMHKDGSFAALPLPSNSHTWRLFFEIPDATSMQSKQVTLPMVKELFATRSGLKNVDIHNPTWLSEFKINCRMVNHFRNGRVFLAGDAAHIHSPTGGQGITTGVQDSANLAWKLGRVLLDRAPDTLLDTYEEERLPKAKEVLNETDRTTTIFFSPNPLVRMLRDSVILPILRMKSFQKRMFGKLSQLHVNYRTNRLARHEVSWYIKGPHLKAGDRVPDIAFQFSDSEGKVTLFELMRNCRPIVLIGAENFPTSKQPGYLNSLIKGLMNLNLLPYVIVKNNFDQPIPGNHCLIDIFGDFEKVYGLNKNFLCVIRPDGHLGLVQKPFHAKGLEKYLQNICSAGDVSREISQTTESAV